MFKGREIVPCAAALFAGNMLGSFLMPAPWLCLALSAVLAVLSALLKKGILLFATISMLGAASVQISRMPSGKRDSAIVQKAAAMKSDFSRYLETILPPGSEESGILKALAIGDKGGVGKELKEAYRKSGAMHLLALSGLHVGIIYALFSFLLGFLGGSLFARRLRTAVTLAFLWSFALISGLSPSIFRAVLMITFYELAGCLSASRDGPAALAGSAIVIMLLQPESPRELSFQLSFSAVAGIFLIYPRLSLLMKVREHSSFLLNSGGKLLKYVWQTACLSISCQASCGMLAYFYFGTFPKYFLVTNLLAIPLATLVMYAIAGALVSSLLPFAGNWTAALLDSAIRLLNATIKILAQM